MIFYLRLTGVVDRKTFIMLCKKGIITNEMKLLTALFCDYSEFDIPLGHTFKYLLIGNKNEKISVFCKAQYAMQAQGLFYDSVPKGHNTLIFFETNNEALLRQHLPEKDGWDYNPNKAYLSDIENIDELLLLNS